MRDKADLRRALLAARSAITTDARRQYDAAIGAHVLAWWRTRPVQTLGIFWPMRGEPDLRDVYAELAAQGVQLALPLVVARDAPLQFAAWAPGAPLEVDAMGVSVPALIPATRQDHAESRVRADSVCRLQRRAGAARLWRRLLRPHAGRGAAPVCNRYRVCEWIGALRCGAAPTSRWI